MEVDERTKEAAMESGEAEDATAGQAELTVEAADEAEASDAIETTQEDADGIERSFDAEDRTKGPLRTDVVEIKMEAESPAPSPASLMFDSGIGLVFADGGSRYLFIIILLITSGFGLFRALCAFVFLQCSGSGMFIPDPILFPPRIPDPTPNHFLTGTGNIIVNLQSLSKFNPKNCWLALRSGKKTSSRSRIRI